MPAEPAGHYYLQVGSFRDKAAAETLKARLIALGFSCEIRLASSNDTANDYLVRVGPFADPEILERSRLKLGELGLETRTVPARE